MRKIFIVFILSLAVIGCILASGCVQTNTNQPSSNQTALNVSSNEVVAYFKEIAQNPRPSGHEEKVRDYLISFAKNHNLSYQTDEVGNILISENGKDGAKKVILQAHMDMVPLAETGKTFDFTTQPITVIEDNGYLRANGTTLGSDDGIGIALILSVLDSAKDDYPDLKISALFTVEEETTGLGASSISSDYLDADYFINLDSETDSEIALGSAGCAELIATFKEEMISADPTLSWYTLSISGLQGGHSGVDIDKNRGNANRLICTILSGLDGVVISSIAGGELSNSIASHAQVVFGIPKEVKISEKVTEFKKKFAEKYNKTDSGLTISIETAAVPEKSFTKEFSKLFLTSLESVPQGVISYDSFGNVQTSCNNGLITFEDGVIVLNLLFRSSSKQELDEYAMKSKEVLNSNGVDVSLNYASSPWRQDENANLVKYASETYRNLFNEDVKIVVLHGGLEVGVISQKKPEMEIISIGPTLTGVHTPQETVAVSSIEKVQKWLHAILKKLESSKGTAA